MTTFNLTGFSVEYDSGDEPVSVATASLAVTFADGPAVLNYTILDSVPEDIPEVDLGGTGPLGATINDVPIGDDAEEFLGEIETGTGTHTIVAFYDPATRQDFIFQIAGDPLTLPATLAEFEALDASITDTGPATGALAPGVDIPFTDLLAVMITQDDYIVVDNAEFFTVDGGEGDDTIDMGTVDPGDGYVALDYSSLAGPIAVDIDGGANTGTVVKSGIGTDTLIDVENPLFAGWTLGGLEIVGTDAGDSFDLAPEGQQWMSVRMGDGVDTLDVNGTGLVRLDFSDATGGIDVDLGTRQIDNDGFGNPEAIGGTGPVWEVFGSAQNDTFVGSADAESYRYLGGDNDLDGGGGFDRLRYDTSTVASVEVNALSGVVNGNFSAGGTFTDTFTGFERLRGSDGEDLIVADNRGNQLEGQGGSDILVGGFGNDTFIGGDGANIFEHKGGFDRIVDFNPGVDTLLIDIPGLTQADVDAAMANPLLFNGEYFVTFGDAQNITFGGLSPAQISSIPATLDIDPSATEPTLIQGSDGDDQLIGTPSDDQIITGDATPNGDFVRGSAGDDTIDMSGMNQSTAFMTMSYQDLGSAITVTVDGAANTATVDKGVLGTDTLEGIENPLFAGFNLGGFGVIGTAQGDTFNLAPGTDQWMQVRGGDGVDSYDIGDTGFVRLDFAFVGATQGAEIDLGLASGQIISDGFGNTETITGPGTVWEIRGTENGDLITGSAADESFISLQGDDTIDGGGGFDRLRYDRPGVDFVTADLAESTVTGFWFGNAFTDTISNIEHLRGSGNDDVLVGNAEDNRLEGGGGDDFLSGNGGDNTLHGGDGVDTFVIGSGATVIEDFELGTDLIGADLDALGGVAEQDFEDALRDAQAETGGARAIFNATDSVTFEGLTPQEVASIADTLDLGVPSPPPPPPTPAAWTLGDPHLLTLDGLGYDFHAVGEYVLLRGQAGEDVGGFEIQSRMTPATDDQGDPLDNVSVNAAIAMRAANGDAVMIDSTDAVPLSVNGSAVNLADGDTLDVGEDRVFCAGDTYTMVFAGADGILNAGDTQVAVVVHDARVDLSVRISEALAGRVEGLLGDGDGDIGNDIARADGTVLERPLAFEDLYGGYRDDWRVDAEADSLFTYDPGETLAGFYDANKPGAVTTLDDFEAGDLAAAQQAVEASGLTPGTLNYDNAVLDFLLTDDQGFIDSAASEDVAAPDTASAAPTLDVGQGRATLNISVTDRAGDGVEGASVGFSTGVSTVRSLAEDAGGGAYTLSVGDGASGQLGGTLAFSNSGEITAGDALEVLRIAVGLDPSWGPAQGLDFVAADLNEDGRVTAGDALEVLRNAVGLDSDNAPKWVFVDSNVDVSEATRDAVPEVSGLDLEPISGTQPVDMTAVLVGDMENFA
jgi:Ca2+-binding RTX toxin-like protein